MITKKGKILKRKWKGIIMIKIAIGTLMKMKKLKMMIKMTKIILCLVLKRKKRKITKRQPKVRKKNLIKLIIILKILHIIDKMI